MPTYKPPAWLANPLFWPSPAVVVAGLVLLFSRQAWIDKLPSRRGAPLSVASGTLRLMLAGLVLYGALLLFEKRRNLSWTDLRAGDSAQEGCALVLVRLLVLALLYLCCINLLLRYVLA